MEDLKLWLWYTMAMGGAKALARELYNKVKSVEKIYNFTRSDYRELGIKTDKKIEALCDKSLDRADKTIWYAKQYGVDFITIDDVANYPTNLKNIYDPPLLLYKRGVHFKPETELYVSIIGTKEASKEGVAAAYNIASDLAAAGVTVVGGMSPGIEMAAHRGCLDAGGKTVAVMVTGVNSASQNNADFMRRVLNNGALLSEFSFDEPFYVGNYAQRNRIITGLCIGTVIVEAPEGSKSLFTAKMAVEQNRDLFAVPGKPGEKNSVGVNELLKEGAILVTEARDILKEYEKTYPGLINTEVFSKYDVEFNVPETSYQQTNIENAIMSSLKGTHKGIQELLNDTKIPISQLNGSITLLELQGKIEKDEFGDYRLTN